MTDASRKSAGGAVEQIMRNITSDRHNVDGQYRQLGYVSPTQHPKTWNIPAQNTYLNSYNMCNNDTQIPFQNINNPSVTYGYQNHYPEQFDKSLNGNDLYGYNNVYSHLQNGIGIQDINNMYMSDFKYMSNMNQHQNIHPIPEADYIPNHQDINTILSNTNIKNHHQPSNKSPLIDNLVGNWTPNTSGTYSPFGNVTTTNVSNIFESDINCLNNVNIERKHNQDCLEKPSDDIINFSFNRDNKKPRIIAEVKPMRPTYSDVLLKTVPNTNIKSGKVEVKDVKIKQMNNKKNLKDLNIEKSSQLPKSSEKLKENKPGQLNRKSVSLDNISESFGDMKSEITEAKNKKNEEMIISKNNIKNSQKKAAKNMPDHVDTDSSNNNKNDSANSSKSSVKKSLKNGSKQRNYESPNNNDKLPSKRNQRNRKRDAQQLPLDIIREKLRIYLENWWKFCVGFLFWLWNLVLDVFSLSLQILRDGACNLWSWSIVNWAVFKDTSISLLNGIRVITWLRDKFKKTKPKGNKRYFSRNGLQYNINMPMTGDEAMKRLLACKGKDPYSILGLTPTCTDDDIKRYYKKQAVLVHPDKNKQLGAEEAFKILVHAFDMIGEPERRAAYDKESAHVEQAWTELTELLAQFQQKVEAASKTIRCRYCGSGHKRIKIDRPNYAARNCNTCKIYHAAREGDIWAEAKYFGVVWRYYACMEGGVYDITTWAGCQKNSLKQLKPDSHNVQYRIAQGKYAGSSCKKHNASGSNQGSTQGSTPRGEEPAANFEDLLNKIYGQMETNSQSNVRRKNSKKSK
ncbi:hypothetical protein Trydic_g18013 [Trypoxylus dichotomus]